MVYFLGIQITGNEGPLTVGSTVQVTCSSDLVILMAEWLYDDMVIAQSVASEAILTIPAVNDSLHNRQYKCRVTTPYGIEEANTTISTTGIIYVLNEIV